MMLREECLEDRRHSALRHNECGSQKNSSFAILGRCYVALIKLDLQSVGEERRTVAILCQHNAKMIF